ncbi:FmdE family protein [Methanobacterium alcaliphilum]|uniref:FmdE family protein n=1 Tax=Methanobacterium alcaliphilum TaxID=392018 RepID=UPI00200A5C17|nr:FmdE family protein [Methanobacterium alcaliphilum]MCK9151945.1 FmdE family protein [Methanobacterium alcaliphilum]
MSDMLNLIEDPQMREDMEKLIKFHGHLSSGALIGYQMLQIAKRKMDILDGEKIFVAAESQNCLPDPFQIIWGSTTGNKRLTVHNYEKMAVTVNKAAPPKESSIQGIRIYLNMDKLKNYPIIYAWFMNERRIAHEEVVPELLKAGEDIYSYDFVNIEVPIRQPKDVVICPKCKESFIKRGTDILCIPCALKESKK